MVKPVIVYKATNDEWHPSFNTVHGKLVFVQFAMTEPYDQKAPVYRVSASGADDFGMEKDFYDETKARNCYLELLNMDTVDIEPLKSLGFYYA